MGMERSESGNVGREAEVWEAECGSKELMEDEDEEASEEKEASGPRSVLGEMPKFEEGISRELVSGSVRSEVFNPTVSLSTRRKERQGRKSSSAGRKTLELRERSHLEESCGGEPSSEMRSGVPMILLFGRDRDLISMALPRALAMRALSTLMLSPDTCSDLA